MAKAALSVGFWHWTKKMGCLAPGPDDALSPMGSCQDRMLTGFDAGVVHERVKPFLKGIL